MLFLSATPDVTPITNLILNWTHIGQALVGSIGALAFIFAFACVQKHCCRDQEPTLPPHPPNGIRIVLDCYGSSWEELGVG
jgi:hypothetical protein